MRNTCRAIRVGPGGGRGPGRGRGRGPGSAPSVRRAPPPPTGSTAPAAAQAPQRHPVPQPSALLAHALWALDLRTQWRRPRSGVGWSGVFRPLVLGGRFPAHGAGGGSPRETCVRMPITKVVLC